MAGSILRRTTLGTPWPTFDPFLFCVHHLDHYPAANGRFGPAASLAGRALGSDFSGRDGWNMYHGRVVPGFPSHPHRGFETITYARRGFIDHSDSLGAAARFGRGDVQWMTAGSGVVHSEMFPLLDRDAPNTVELFQIWLNLPAANKLVDPHFSMMWAADIPVLTSGPETGGEGGGGPVEVTVIAGRLGDLVPPAPPPDSWAARPEADVAIWHVSLGSGGRFTLPPAAGPTTARMLYVFDGGPLDVAGDRLDRGTGALVDALGPVTVGAGEGGAECLVMQGRPIGEPVAQYGPFVMNTQAEIHQAFEDYRRTGFGGWPWPVDDPVHGADPERFARGVTYRQESAPR